MPEHRWQTPPQEEPVDKPEHSQEDPVDPIHGQRVAAIVEVMQFDVEVMNKHRYYGHVTQLRRLTQPLHPAKVISMVMIDWDEWTRNSLFRLYDCKLLRLASWIPKGHVNRFGSFGQHFLRPKVGLFEPKPIKATLCEIDAAACLGWNGVLWGGFEGWKCSYFLTASALVFGGETECTVFRGFGAHALPHLWKDVDPQRLVFRFLARFCTVIWDALRALQFLHSKKCLLNIGRAGRAAGGFQAHVFYVRSRKGERYYGLLGNFGGFVRPPTPRVAFNVRSWTEELLWTANSLVSLLPTAFRVSEPTATKLEPVQAMLRYAFHAVRQSDNFASTFAHLETAQRLLSEAEVASSPQPSPPKSPW